MSEATVGEGLASVAAELAGLTKAVDALTERVGEQNGRVGKIENRCAAHQLESVTRTRTEMAVEDKLESMEVRMRDLETIRDIGKGKTAAALGIFQTVATIITLLVALYTIIEARPAHESVPAAQHQAK